MNFKSWWRQRLYLIFSEMSLRLLLVSSSVFLVDSIVGRLRETNSWECLQLRLPALLILIGILWLLFRLPQREGCIWVAGRQVITFPTFLYPWELVTAKPVAHPYMILKVVEVVMLQGQVYTLLAEWLVPCMPSTDPEELVKLVAAGETKDKVAEDLTFCLYYELGGYLEIASQYAMWPEVIFGARQPILREYSRRIPSTCGDLREAPPIFISMVRVGTFEDSSEALRAEVIAFHTLLDQVKKAK